MSRDRHPTHMQRDHHFTETARPLAADTLVLHHGHWCTPQKKDYVYGPSDIHPPVGPEMVRYSWSDRAESIRGLEVGLAGVEKPDIAAACGFRL